MAETPPLRNRRYASQSPTPARRTQRVRATTAYPAFSPAYNLQTSDRYASSPKRLLLMALLAFAATAAVIMMLSSLTSNSASAVSVNDSSAETTAATSTASIPSSAQLSVNWIGQMPQLPTGCEITSATMMLDYYGFSATKTQMNTYLAQSGTIQTYQKGFKKYGPDPDEEFIGSTTSEDGCSCNPGPVINALNEYLSESGSSAQAVNLTGSSASQLYAQVAAGNPVEVWVTIDMEQRQVSDTWYSESDGGKVQIGSNDHAMLLVGYTQTSVILEDPLEGQVTYSKTAFETSYKSRGQMAAMIQA